jgi:hypothetical protein
VRACDSGNVESRRDSAARGVSLDDANPHSDVVSDDDNDNDDDRVTLDSRNASGTSSTRDKGSRDAKATTVDE